MVEEGVLGYLDSRGDEIVDFLRRLVGIPSVVGLEGEAQKFMYHTFRDMGLEVDMWEPDINELKKHPAFFETTSFRKYGYKDRPNVIGKLRGVGGGRSLFLCGHMDVVSPEPVGAWSYPPWGGVVVDGKMYGRGAADQKGGIASMTYALKSIIDLGIKLKGDVLIGTTIEEEDGGVGGALATVMKGYRADAAILTEPGGNRIGVASAGVLYFRVKVMGRTAHASRAHLGVNAIEKAFLIYRALMELNVERQRRVRYVYAENEAPHMRGRATTINVGVVRGGDWPSTVAGWAELECRVGWPPGESVGDVRREIEAKVMEVAMGDSWLRDHPPIIEWFGWCAEPSEQDVNHPIVKLVKSTAEEVLGEGVVFAGGSAGLDTRHFILYGGMPAITFGPEGENTHGVDECVNLDSVIKTSKVLALVLLRWCGLA
ncbi:MAG: ArgE/DapE family deacylase [archaeon YNP-LCB-003-016]|uniref:ArgE/DapE family deacylase n=1 Tax=Candidatus Culexarchaeum yellowstonense TaxID=2928963 RepID=UPI0026E9308C|nr:ArgE/DapE family deacylase [Candidatus Culexarchaeum yellowstonense]MCR6691985.1 ArgE/DapE family deacylase [Candidatus Culexarchaeum yellowstonense]